MTAREQKLERLCIALRYYIAEQEILFETGKWVFALAGLMIGIAVGFWWGVE